MILDVFNLGLFDRVNEISISLEDSYYSLCVKLKDERWTFNVYYIQKNHFDNVLVHKKFIKDFENCIDFMGI